MLRNIRLNLTRPSCRQGSTVEGLITFDTSSPRAISDFALSIDLTATLHLAIPTRSGIQAHTDRILYTHSQAVEIKKELAPRLTRFMIPFSVNVSTACPISAQYLAMANLHHTLEAKITDLCLGHEPFCSDSVNLLVLAAQEDTKGVANTKRQAKVTCSANVNMFSGSKYFVQFAHPHNVHMTSCRPRLLTELQISDGANTFVKHTERTLSDFQMIHRTSPDGSRLTVMLVNVPPQVESSLKVPGFRRSHIVSIDVLLNQKNKVNFQSPVGVIQILDEPKQTAAHNRAAIISMLEDPFSLDLAFTAPPSRPAPVPESLRKSRVVHNRSLSIVPSAKRELKPVTPLKNLSMDQLANKALGHDTNDDSSEASSRSDSGRPSSASSQGSTRDSSSIHRSGSGSSSPKSVASSVFSLSGTPQTPSKIEASSETSHKQHNRQRSSISMLTKRTSALFSFSPLSKRRQPAKDLEISCCGSTNPPSHEMKHERQNSSVKRFTFPSVSESTGSPRPSTPVSQVSRESAATPETPGSAYSSMPSSPKQEDRDYFPSPPNSPSHASVLARKLSFKRTSNRDIPIYDKQLLSPMQDKRFSISDSYLSGFDFEGLSSLDSSDAEDTEDGGLAIYRKSTFGLAL